MYRTVTYLLACFAFPHKKISQWHTVSEKLQRSYLSIPDKVFEDKMAVLRKQKISRTIKGTGKVLFISMKRQKKARRICVISFHEDAWIVAFCFLCRRDKDHRTSLHEMHVVWNRKTRFMKLGQLAPAWSPNPRFLGARECVHLNPCAIR